MKKLCLLFTLAGALWASPAERPRYFEALPLSGAIYAGRGFGYPVELSARSIRMVRADGQLLHLRMENASPAAELQGEDALPARSHYLTGNEPAKWRSNVPHLGRLRARQLYPGTDLTYYPGARGLEFDFICAPFANPNRVRLRFDRAIALAPDGSAVDAASGERLLNAPDAYELDGEGRRYPIASQFQRVAADVVSFTVGARHPGRVLVIDPTLTYATYLGGSAGETIVAMERGPDGGVYVAGYTNSIDLPQAVSLNSILLRPISLRFSDLFVARYTPDGSALVYIVYVGGNQIDLVNSLAVDPQGRATVAGMTGSYNFPTTPGAYQRSRAGRAYDAFCLRLSSDGSALEYSTMLQMAPVAPYSNIDPSQVKLLVGVDSSGTATLAGASSTGLSVQATAGALQANPLGNGDVFLERLNNTGTAVLSATWYGGAGMEKLASFAVDATGNAYIAGSTSSTNLPVSHPFQSAPPTNNSGFAYTAGFFAKVTPDNQTLAAASYYGGQRSQSGIDAIALDAAGNIYLSGTSPLTAAPGLAEVPGPVDANFAGTAPAFLVKLDPSGQIPLLQWAYSTVGLYSVIRLRADSQSRPCILGRMTVQKTTVGALFGGTFDTPSLVCLEADGKTLRYATSAPSSGSSDLTMVDFAVDPSGELWGAANSNFDRATSGLPPVTSNAPQPSPGGSTDGYIFRISPNNPLPQLTYVTPFLVTPPATGSAAYTIVGSGFAKGAQINWNGTPLDLFPSSVSVNPDSLSFSLSADALAKLPRGDSRITVSMPGPGGGTSNALTLKVLNPPPYILNVAPAVVPVGTADVTFTLTGTFTSDATVTWDGQAQAVTFLSLSQSTLKFTVPGSAFAKAGDHVIALSVPRPGGGIATIHVGVTPSGLAQTQPVITDAVVIVGVGQAGIPQTLNAKNFSNSDVTVVWNGSDRPTTASFGTVRFVLTLDDLSRMRSAQVQIRSGGVLSAPATAYVGVKLDNSYTVADVVRGRAYFFTTNGSFQSTVLASVAIPSGDVLQTLDLKSRGVNLVRTEDNRYLYVLTGDQRLRRIDLDTFAIDYTVALPPASGNGALNAPNVVPVPGRPETVIAAGTDGVLRIFDGEVERPASTFDIGPDPGILNPLFATLDVVWAAMSYPNNRCVARLHYNLYGFTGFQKNCAGSSPGPWGLDAPEVKYDGGAVWAESGGYTYVWVTPRGGILDISRRWILSLVQPTGNSTSLAIYSLDTEEQIGSVPANGAFPWGTTIPWGATQILSATGDSLVLVDL